MQLIVMHKIVMGTAIFSSAAFSVWSLYMWNKTGAPFSAFTALVGTSVTIGVALYLRGFIAKHADQQKG